MEIYADPRAAGPGGHARTPDAPATPRRAVVVCKRLCTEHVPRIRALRDADRSRPSTATPRAPRGHLSVASTLVRRPAGRARGGASRCGSHHTRTFTTCLGTTIPTAALHTSNLCGASGHDFIARDPRTLFLSQPSCFTW